ncbi:peroxiredoxin [Parvicella tangerina]|uniref:thioredoxin-dependent peroxiredoxin n=1 Tax=Parvicella tangerina TaxID=2829795 RepID=A0A916JMB5_9FLAO|nr:peroxiredoxin [Parvicella tangerina]CAG5081709.1 Putative peroxiredoxin bcp [Parvicella tangerina]
MLKVGDKCPLFKGIDQNGDEFDASTVIGKKRCVIYFYPKNETKVCTAQACAFRDAYETFKDNNCEVIGISGDSAKSHQAFAENHSLPFVLISDGDKSIRKLFEVPKDFLIIPGRYTFIVDENGIILEIFHDAAGSSSHTKTAFNVLNIDPL